MSNRKNRPVQRRDAQGAILNHQNDDDKYVGRYASNTVRYHGYARPTVTEDEARWKVFRETLGDGPFDSGSTISVQFAEGSNDYETVWDDSTAVVISAVNDGNPAQVTTSAAHGYSNGDVVEIDDTSVADLDEHFFTVTVVDATKFTIGKDRTALATPVVGNAYKRSFSNYVYS